MFNKLTVSTYNINSANTNNITKILDKAKGFDNKNDLSIIIVQEAFGFDWTNIRLQDQEHFNFEWSEQKYRGQLLITNKNTKSKLINLQQIPVNKSLISAHTINIGNKEAKILVINIYLPPKELTKTTNIEEIHNTITNLLQNHEHHKIIRS